MKDEALTGNGCGSAKKEENAEEAAEVPESEKFKDIDLDVMFKELNDLHTVQESFIKDEEMTKHAKEFKRLFSVLMLEVKYCAKTSKF